MEKQNTMHRLVSMLIILCIAISSNLIAQTCNNSAQTENDKKFKVMKTAAKDGDLELIKKLVEVKGVDVNTVMPDNQTMLIFAASKGHLEVVEYLLDKGADISTANDKGNTAFNAAVMKGNKEITMAILAKGADVNQKGQWGFSALHQACWKQKVEVAQFLVEKGADIDQNDDYGRPPIIIASWNGNIEIMKFLVDNGADVNYATESKNTVLHNLARGGYYKSIQLALQNNGNANVLDQQNTLPIYYAVQNRYSEAVKLLAKNTKDLNQAHKITGNTVLHIASTNGDLTSAQILIEAGANPKQSNMDNETPIDYAVKYAQIEVLDFYIEQKYATKSDYKLALANKNKVNDPVSKGNAHVVYSGHSGWIIQTSNKVLVFDYWSKNKPQEACLANGSFCPKEMKDKDVYVFVSHAHGDHYDTIINSWAQKVKNIHYVYGFNPHDAKANKKNGYKGPEYTFIENNSSKIIDEVGITTLKSNDSGQGFLITADDVSIYHPGDHAWFSEEDEEIFKEEVDFIKTINNQVDIAFLPVSGCPSRWKKEYIVQGFNYCIDQLNPSVVYPMHAFQNEYMLKEFEELAKVKSNSTQIVCVKNTGDMNTLNDPVTANK